MMAELDKLISPIFSLVRDIIHYTMDDISTSNSLLDIGIKYISNIGAIN